MINIHAKIWFIETIDFTAVVTYGAEDTASSTLGALVLACESLDLNPDDYPQQGTDWTALLLGSPVSTFMSDRVIVVRRKRK